MTLTQPATPKLTFTERNNAKDAFAWIYLLSSSAIKTASNRTKQPVTA